ncbi:MAG: PAS domain S-box protein, partial [Bacteroidota bacterium]
PAPTPPDAHRPIVFANASPGEVHYRLGLTIQTPPPAPPRPQPVGTKRRPVDRLVNLLPSGLIIVDFEGTVQLLNDAMVKMLARTSRSEVIGRHIDSLLPAPNGRPFDDLVSRLSEGSPTRYETSLVGEGIDTRPVEVRAESIRWSGRPAIQFVVRDLSERESWARVLQRRDDLLHAITFGTERFLRQDINEQSLAEFLKRIGTASKASRVFMIENSGSQESLFGQPIFLWSADSIEPGLKIGEPLPYTDFGLGPHTDALSAGQPVFLAASSASGMQQAILDRRDVHGLGALPITVCDAWWGTLIFETCTSGRLWTRMEQDGFRTAASTLGAALEQWKTQQALDETRARFHALSEATIEGIVVHNGRRILDVNPAAAEMFGINSQDASGRPVLSLFCPSEQTHLKAHLADADQPAIQAVGLRAGVERFPVEVLSKKIPYKDQTAYVMALRDLTDRQKREEAAAARARQKEAFSQAIMEMTTESRRVGTDMNPAYQIITERTAQALGVDRVGLWFFDESSTTLLCADLYLRETGEHLAWEHEIDVIDHPAVFEQLSQVRSRAIHRIDQAPERARLLNNAERSSLQSALDAPIRRHGHLVGVIMAEHLQAERTWTSEEELFMGAVADFVSLAFETASRRLIEQQLMTKNELLASINHNIREGIYRSRPAGGLIYANDAFVNMFGYGSFEEIRTVPSGDLYAESNPRSAVQRETRDREIDQEVEFKRKDGSTFWGLVRSTSVFDESGTILYYDGAISDISYQKRQHRELVRAKEKAEEMNQLKSAFLANMSHEIRTPLTSIIGFAEIMADTAEGEHSEYAMLIHQSGRRLLTTLNSVLDLAQLEGRAMRVRSEQVDLSKAVTETAQLFSVQARTRGINVHSETPDEPVYVDLDPGLLDRILVNLVGNAVKFTNEGHVCVRVRRRGPSALLEVEDTGVGIDPEFLPYLFQEFHQESTGEGRHFEGSGLGLTITKRLVEMMNGKIQVESEKGVGTTFTVHFPVMMEPAPQHVEDEARVADEVG